MHELKLHTTYCKSFGIPIAEMRATEEKQGQCPPQQALAAKSYSLC